MVCCKNFNERVLKFLLNNKKVSKEIREKYKERLEAFKDGKSNKNMGRTS